LVCGDGAYSSKLCANAYVNPLLHLAMQQCEALPWESAGRTQDNDMVLMLPIL
jgi:L-arabinose isomerase